MGIWFVTLCPVASGAVQCFNNDCKEWCNNGCKENARTTSEVTVGIGDMLGIQFVLNVFHYTLKILEAVS